MRELDEAVMKQVIGGRGLGIELLFEYCRSGIDALDPANPLILTIGPFCGTDWPSSVQTQITAKSPLTHALGGAFTWGSFGKDLASQGLTGIVITGKASEPVSCHIEKGSVYFEDAAGLWGLDTRETSVVLRERYPGASTAIIGPAGEQLAGLGTIVFDEYHTSPRTGLGAVMGSKQLKSLTIYPNTPNPQVPRDFQGLVQVKRKQVMEHPASVKLKNLGKAMLLESKNQVGDLATNNHQLTHFDGLDTIGVEELRKYVVGNKPCPGCAIECIKRVDTGTTVTEALGYEPLWGLGPRIGNGDLPFIIEIYEECLKYGIDPVGFGGITAFAMECSQRDLLEGRVLPWGDKDAVRRLLAEVVSGEGLGGELRDGSREFTLHHLETRPYAMEVKGVELSGQEPRQSQAFGLSLAVSNWGGDWGYGLPTLDVSHNLKAAEKLFPELLPEILEVTSPVHKPQLVKFSEEFNALSDSFGLCKFSCPETFAIMPDDLLEGYNAIFGEQITLDSLMALGERIINMERLFNLREGLSGEDDVLPDRFLHEPVSIEKFTGDRLTGLESTGEHMGIVNQLERMKSEYYALRGWDEGGKPEERTLRRLGLLDHIAR